VCLVGSRDESKAGGARARRRRALAGERAQAAAALALREGVKSPWWAPQIPKRGNSFVWQSMCSENAFAVHPDRFGTIFGEKQKNQKHTLNVLF
jgi:hypothetical protein